MLVKTVFVHRSGLSAQELPVWLLDSHFRLQLSYQIGKEKKKHTKKGSLFKDSIKYRSTRLAFENGTRPRGS